jgi:hypothetical protein
MPLSGISRSELAVLEIKTSTVAWQGGGQFELRLQFGREILQGMDRDIDFSAQ